MTLPMHTIHSLYAVVSPSFSEALRPAPDERIFDVGGYPIMFPNSVIEHVGTWECQQAFAREVRRLIHNFAPCGWWERLDQGTAVKFLAEVRLLRHGRCNGFSRIA